jgi:hypothetical protein
MLEPQVTQLTEIGESDPPVKLGCGDAGCSWNLQIYSWNIKTKLRGLSLRANYTDRVTAACWWQLKITSKIYIVL